jgi:hypothetical protein
MRRALFVILLCVLPAVGGARPESGTSPEPPPTVKVIASAKGESWTWGNGGLGGTHVPRPRVYRSVEEVAQEHPGRVRRTLDADLARDVGVNKIDWSKQMMVVIHGPAQSRSDGRIVIRKLSVSGKRLTICWQVEKAHPYWPGFNANLCWPSRTFLVSRFSGKVFFQELLDPVPE